MIDEKKLIEDLKKNNFDVLMSDAECFGLEKCTENIIELINEQPKIGEWIPCSERLPEMHRVDMQSEEEYYMISDSVIITDGERISVSEYEVDDGDREGWLAHDFEEIEDVIAWMPIPEPYRQGEEE